MKLPLFAVALALLPAAILSAGMGTPITVGDGSIRLGPAKVLKAGEWDDVGAGLKKRRGAGSRIAAVAAAGPGVTSTPTASCDNGRNCSLTVVFRNAAASPEFVTVTVSSERAGKGVHIQSSVDWDDFSWGDTHGVISGAFQVVSAEFASGPTRTKLCAGAGCTITVSFP